MTILDDQAHDLYDLLQAAAPNMVPRDDLMESLGLIGGRLLGNPNAAPTVKEVTRFHRIKGVLQDHLAAADVVTVVGDPSTNGLSCWSYGLQGDPSHPIATLYLVAKTKNTFLRQKRQYLIHKTLAAGIPGNTTVGRYARRLMRSQYRALEDTVDVLVELGASAPPLP